MAELTVNDIENIKLRLGYAENVVLTRDEAMAFIDELMELDDVREALSDATEIANTNADEGEKYKAERDALQENLDAANAWNEVIEKEKADLEAKIHEAGLDLA